MFARITSRSMASNARNTRRYASTVTPPTGPAGSGGNNNMLIGGGLVAAVGLYFWYTANRNKVDHKAGEMREKTKEELKDAQQRAAKALK
ncbi:uncharacterized protein L203_105973 [Cryptococcus depauperatus CBS 7841]|uniref:Uncharacterized protein n=1 Tax=Cryptococcus depauperatus CBS 7841 TaxID=1295531 RepID=A0A1E3IVD4_9TREE|nr:hypothetical protein L204_06229 [Cryptococcus depauperatus CBS 7855]ODN92405.1 hypothetical protein L203_00681 [Cryptococcus depauperatus CBS 7841]